MAVPSNRTTNPALDGGSWSPERELTEAAPRRYAPSPLPDYNQPNAPVLLGLGGLLLVVGMVLFFVAFSNADNKRDVLYIIGGAIMSIGGAAMIAYYPARKRQHEERAATLVENGAPIMARIVNVQNMTDSPYERMVTYMVNMPGANEETRREVKADDRALPKRIPGPATALIDFKSNEIELYCALPFVAVSKFATASTASQQASLTEQTGIPMQTPVIPTMQTQTQRQTQDSMPTVPTMPSTAGDMPTLGEMAPPPMKPPIEKPKEPKKPASTGGAASKLPWEQ